MTNYEDFSMLFPIWPLVVIDNTMDEGTIQTNDLTLVSENHQCYDDELNFLIKHQHHPTPSTPPVKKRNTRVGYCEHPKHVFYRQYPHQRKEEDKKWDGVMRTPRRGRPPKGTTSTDCHLSLYQIAMTTRPLPKRLEAVVGYSNIHVCLTCLKRSDMDLDYLMHPAYIGPQTTRKTNPH
ncbi:uncharacterized protein BX664DRAFT_318483 [Halteromyces radiatus]|uniref:uncharacterized protein n=1 Tax=Halteromyces radiatus TaxID=101107 RepID=UPI00221F7D38|nr:uncharacterized protein BX664DRAFT_318483 [Halteromyces radiatus]KAI8076748.1 hypothetical protein BX664DRAFT_318483 [Halteromyces radiatus]